MKRIILALVLTVGLAVLAQNARALEITFGGPTRDIGAPLVLVDHRGPGGDRDRGRNDDRRDSPWWYEPYWRSPNFRTPYWHHPRPRPNIGIGHPPVVIVPYPGHPPVLIAPIPDCRPGYPYRGRHFYYQGRNFGLWIDF
ncbi:MAG: hypothetical protein NZ899_06970 [Thermoguttaceae bacterium]|nr:hypothetical protein [Thermoguttaceae bacterium]MDW8078492.1 hypothetical protein [Thermoguttaceae bacterium]